MSKNIFDRHAEEWENYFQAYDKTRNQLEADELLIRQHFGMNDKDMPAELRDMLSRHREAWVSEWGHKGTKQQEISERHDREIKAGYKNSFPEVVPVEIPEPQPVSKNIIPEIPQYKEEEMNQLFADQRAEAQQRLKDELNAVEDAYKQWGEPVPAATQKRMARRVMAFNEQWYDIKPDTPLKDTMVMNEKDHQNHFQSFRDLAKSHTIIEAHYGHPDNVPEATRKEFAREKEEFHNEVDAYQVQRKQQQEAFKTRLENMRNQNQTPTRKPK